MLSNGRKVVPWGFQVVVNRVHRYHVRISTSGPNTAFGHFLSPKADLKDLCISNIGYIHHSKHSMRTSEVSEPLDETTTIRKKLASSA